MKKTRYSESQIVKTLQEVEGGRNVKAICREYSIPETTYYNWKSKYGGMEASDIKRLKELEDENRRLKQMYVELSLDHKLLKDIVEKSCKASDTTGGRSTTQRSRIRFVFDEPIVLLP
jgi:putative transposase|tara:strand:+ start:743 stop:1096 length:354 start_codon:yes stop_codon:yes gene_type:complete